MTDVTCVSVLRAAYCHDGIPVGLLWRWYRSGGPVAARVRQHVEEQELDKEAVARAEGLQYVADFGGEQPGAPFMLWLHSELMCPPWSPDKKQAPAAPQPEAARLLFLVMCFEAVVRNDKKLGSLDLTWLSRPGLPATWGADDVEHSDRDFLPDFSVMETSPGLVAAQRHARACGQPCSAVRLQYLSGLPVEVAGGASEVRASGCYRSLDTAKAPASHLLEELAAAARSAGGLSGDCPIAGWRHWTMDYLYFMVHSDSCVDAWSHAHDERGRPLDRELPTWGSFVEEQLTAGLADTAEVPLWRMASSHTDGVRLSTAKQRCAFRKKYGWAMFWSLLQGPCQHHKCSKEYCCPDREELQKGKDGKSVWVKVPGVCRFGYLPGRGLGFRLRPSLQRHPRLVVEFSCARNMPWYAECNPPLGVIAKSNGHWRVICAVQPLVAYSCSYSCKQGKQSGTFKDILKKSAEDGALTQATTAGRVMRELYKQLAGQVDVTPHECWSHVLQQEMYRTSRDVVFVCGFGATPTYQVDLATAAGERGEDDEDPHAAAMRPALKLGPMRAYAAAQEDGAFGEEETPTFTRFLQKWVWAAKNKDIDPAAMAAGSAAEAAACAAGAARRAAASGAAATGLCCRSAVAAAWGWAAARWGPASRRATRTVQVRLRRVAQATLVPDLAEAGTKKRKSQDDATVVVYGAVAEMDPCNPEWCRQELIMMTVWRPYEDWPLVGDAESSRDYTAEYSRWLHARSGSAAAPPAAGKEAIALAERHRLLSPANAWAMSDRHGQDFASMADSGAGAPEMAGAAGEGEGELNSQRSEGVSIGDLQLPGTPTGGVEFDKMEPLNRLGLDVDKVEAMANWVHTTRAQSGGRMYTNDRAPARPYEELNLKQRIAAHIIWTNRGRAHVFGTAGTGKSTLIHYISEKFIAQYGSLSVEKAAYTGTAAGNIGGCTLHSSVAIPMDARMRDKSGNLVCLTDPTPGEGKLQKKWKKKEILMIDEISLPPSSLLGHFVLRCQQVQGQESVRLAKEEGISLGNLPVGSFGDFFQVGGPWRRTCMPGARSVHARARHWPGVPAALAIRYRRSDLSDLFCR